MNLIKKIDQAISYDVYIGDLEKQVEEKRENEKILNYLYLNLKRMKRIQKQYEPAPYLNKLIRKINIPVTWLTITEGWCGDAAHILPVLNNLTAISFKPDLKIVFRDDGSDLIEDYLTDGSRSIPIVLAVDEDGQVISKWGPRPSFAQKIVQAYKTGDSPYANYNDMSEALQKWYHYDRFQSFESEIVEFIEPQIRSKSLVRV